MGVSFQPRAFLYIKVIISCLAKVLFITFDGRGKMRQFGSIDNTLREGDFLNKT